MLPLHTRATIAGRPSRSCLKVLQLQEFLRSSYAPEHCALWVDASESLRRSRALEDVAWGAAFFPGASTHPDPASAAVLSPCVVSALRQPAVVAPGDVIAINEHSRSVSVLYRRASHSNSILVTERCNSYCVMCSQPPLERDESGWTNSILASIPLMDRTIAQLGITGGEPTLLGESLAQLLSTLRSELPSTVIHVLTNGRRFADEVFTARICESSSERVIWGVPLYSDAPEIHDYVTQRAGSFAETLRGLLNLAMQRQHIELRIVLQKAVIPRLPQLAHFIARNLTFVDHVAWMGLEPMGFARANWDHLWIEPEDYLEPLRCALTTLDSRGMTSSIYNVPLCALPVDLRPFAAKSISDWKNTFLPECSDCTLRSSCCGFFASAGRQHIPRSIHAVRENASCRDS